MILKIRNASPEWEKGEMAGGYFCVKSTLPRSPKTNWDKTNNSQEPQCATEWEKDEKAFVSFPFLGRIFDKGRFSVYPDLSIARIYPSTSFSAA